MIPFCKHCIPVICLLLFFTGCRQQPERIVERGFYYWKSQLQLSESETTTLQQLQVKQLYVKFFDVIPAEDGNGAMPVAKLYIDSGSLKQLHKEQVHIIPVIFITNETLQQSDSAQLLLLAQNIGQLLQIISKQNKLEQYSELQIDCDWTKTTRENYFFLLEQIKKGMQQTALFKNSLLTATIRLHQVKFSNRTGIPPVDRGLLMCYNMGNLKNPAVNNSIIDVDELKKYLGSLKSYPLQLDIALPLFEWSVLLRNNQFKGIIQTVNPSTLSNSICSKAQNRYTFLKDTVIANINFYKNDLLRFEESSATALKQTATFIAANLSVSNTQTRISFYHLDQLLLTKHPTHELEALYRCFYLR
jgi:hypothetical protein